MKMITIALIYLACFPKYLNIDETKDVYQIASRITPIRYFDEIETSNLEKKTRQRCVI